MMKTSSMWRWLAVVSAAAFALALAASAFAQVPQVPHTFYGSGATLDGQTSDGTVTATNEDGEAVGSASIDMGTWSIDVSPDDAMSVTFSIDGSDPSGSYNVEPGSATDVSLALTSPMDDTDDGDGDDMGDTGDGDGDGDDMGDTGDGDDQVTDDDATDDTGDDMGQPDGLPDTGSGGLAGDSGLPALPLAIAISIAVALGGVLAVRRIRA